jgi:hypothetical protein
VSGRRSKLAAVVSARSWTSAADRLPNLSSLVAANHLCADPEWGWPTTRRLCPHFAHTPHATLTRYRFSCTLNLLFSLDGDCIFVSALHFGLLVRTLVWQTATPIDVAEAVLRPNQRANGTRSLSIKPHVQHLAVVSFLLILAYLLICLVYLS